jgi:hypothetical protein
MDMKRILQAMDGVATKPVVGANDMARFLRVVSEADLNQMPDPRQDTQTDGTPTYTPDELADIQHPNAAEWVAVRNQIQDAKAKGIDPAEIAKLQARYDQLAGGNAERWEQTYAKNQAVKAADQAAGYNNNVRYVTPATTVQENDLSKFLSIVDKNNVNLLMEGSPHKVSLPVQMAMQHYQKAESTPKTQPACVGRESVVRKYFDQAEQAVQEEQIKKKNFYKQYAQTIAERVLMKEGIAGTVAKGAVDHWAPATTVGGGAVHAAAGNIDSAAGEWWNERIFPALPYSRFELAVDLGVVGMGAVAGAFGGPPGEAAALAANATRIERIAKIITKVLSYIGADVKKVSGLLPTIKEWVKSLGKTALTTTAFHTLIDLIDDALRSLDEKDANMGFKPQGPGLQSNAPDGGHLNLSELSTDTLGKYKKAAYADAKKADAEGDYARGDKRFKGINKATIKQFDNDLKKHNQNPIKEANAKKRTLKNSNPCWDGYKPVGTKKKGGRTVPNCVPKD